jgi:polyisoprenyl-phosphate glycosyltransferase
MARANSKTISIIIPLFNEEKNIPLIYEAISTIFSKIKYDYELIFINDSSSDKSMLILEKLSELDHRITVVDLTRNFGKEAALTAGLHTAKGEAALLIDADLQHPPSYIPHFIAKWEKGAEIVVGVRQSKEGEAWYKQIGARFFYYFINKISETEITPHATDFRLLDRIVIDEFNRLSERNRITRGLIDWLGFKRAYVHYQQAPRRFGQPAYTFDKLVRLGMDSVISMSLLPLKLAGYLGFFITLISGIMGLFIFIENYVLNDPLKLHFSGPAILGVLILFLVGIILICLGLVALYIGNIHSEVSNRPLYIVRTKKL